MKNLLLIKIIYFIDMFIIDFNDFVINKLNKNNLKF
jgi:hypothetical protein